MGFLLVLERITEESNPDQYNHQYTINKKKGSDVVPVPVLITHGLFPISQPTTTTHPSTDNHSYAT